MIACTDLPPELLLLPKNKKACYAQTHQTRALVRKLRLVKWPKPRKPPPAQKILFGSTWAAWRRWWLGYIGDLWKNTLSPAQRAWWDTESLNVPFYNYRNVLTSGEAFELFMWYQFSCFDLHTDRYIPVTTNAADFPLEFTPPWDPPSLEAPTIVSATSPSIVVVRCLNKTALDIPVEPVCLWSMNPPIILNFPRKRYAWFYASKTVDGNHTDYTYDLEIPFPHIKTGTRAALIHRYGNRLGGPYYTTDPTSPSYAADGGGADVPWTDPMNVCTYDATVAQAQIDIDAGKHKSNALLITNFQFDPPIPNDAIPVWIKAEIMAQCEDYRFTISDLTIRLLKNGVPVGLNAAWVNWGWDKTFPWAYNWYPNPLGLWNTTWTPADLNNTGFGLSVTVNTPAAYGLARAWIAHAQITVYYSIPIGWFTLPSLTYFTFA